MPVKTIAELSCPTPLPARDKVLLGHGSGGKLSAELIRDVFLPALQNPVLAQLNDQAVVNINGLRLALTTDSFVVKPLFFPGGDIGSLAVHGLRAGLHAAVRGRGDEAGGQRRPWACRSRQSRRAGG